MKEVRIADARPAGDASGPYVTLVNMSARERDPAKWQLAVAEPAEAEVQDRFLKGVRVAIPISLILWLGIFAAFRSFLG